MRTVTNIHCNKEADMTKNWVEKKDQFDVVDVRKLTGNFLPKLLIKAAKIDNSLADIVVNFGEKNPDIGVVRQDGTQ